MRWLESAYPDKARGWVGFNVPMSHKITAACDLLLMPSRFEPCGLNQLYAMRYGTVPVAHATGGLRDTVLPFNPWEGRKQQLGMSSSICDHAYSAALVCRAQSAIVYCLMGFVFLSGNDEYMKHHMLCI